MNILSIRSVNRKPLTMFVMEATTAIVPRTVVRLEVWLPASAIADGLYYGIRVGGRLVSAAGTHVISASARLAVVGNVMTHADHRGRGYATAVTSAVTSELLRFCDQVVLNVRADNPPALAAYRRLGYQTHVTFEERLIHRSEPAWSGWTGPIRRLFAARKES